MLISPSYLIGKSVTINSNPITVTSCEHFLNFNSVIVNGIYQIYYQQFLQLCGLTDSQTVINGSPTIPSITAQNVVTPPDNNAPNLVQPGNV